MEPNLFLLLTVICGRNGGERRGKRKKSDKWKQKKRRKVDSIDGEKTIIMKKGIRGCSTQNSSFLMLNLICSKKLSFLRYLCSFGCVYCTPMFVHRMYIILRWT